MAWKSPVILLRPQYRWNDLINLLNNLCLNQFYVHTRIVVRDPPYDPFDHIHPGYAVFGRDHVDCGFAVYVADPIDHKKIIETLAEGMA